MVQYYQVYRWSLGNARRAQGHSLPHFSGKGLAINAFPGISLSTTLSPSNVAEVNSTKHEDSHCSVCGIGSAFGPSSLLTARRLQGAKYREPAPEDDGNIWMRRPPHNRQSCSTCLV